MYKTIMTDIYLQFLCVQLYEGCVYRPGIVRVWREKCTRSHTIDEHYTIQVVQLVL